MSDTPAGYRVRPPAKSRVVGPARQDDGATTMAYRAVQPHVCGECGAEIAPDALFSRRTVQRTQTLPTSLARMLVCTICRPCGWRGMPAGRATRAVAEKRRSIMTGEWVRKTSTWWQYRLDGQERPSADVLRQRKDRPGRARWDALPTGGIGMAPLVEGVSLEEAKATVERHAHLHANRLSRRGEGRGMSMDQSKSTGAERERVVQQERADARGRVQAAQDQEVTARVEQRVEQQRRADEYARTRPARTRPARTRSRAAGAGDGDVTAAPAARGPVEREGEGVEGDSSLRPDGYSA